MRILYLDESGNHNLREFNPSYPFFVLGGVMVDYGYSVSQIEPAIARFKQRHFQSDQVILHANEMFRPAGDFAFLKEASARIHFYADLNATLDQLDFQVIACVIRKSRHVTNDQQHARDPYEYGLDIVVEQFCRELTTTAEVGIVYAEKRNKGVDRDLIERWMYLRRLGTPEISAQSIRERIVDLVLVDKKPNIACMQIADLVASVIGRWQ